MLISVYDNDGNFVDDMTSEEFDAWCEEQDDICNVEGIVVDPCDTEIDNDNDKGWYL